MSENRWEILEVGERYVLNGETGAYVPTKLSTKYLLRKKEEKWK